MILQRKVYLTSEGRLCIENGHDLITRVILYVTVTIFAESRHSYDDFLQYS